MTSPEHFLHLGFFILPRPVFGANFVRKQPKVQCANMPSFVTARSDGDHPGLSGRVAATISALVRPAGASDAAENKTFIFPRERNSAGGG